MWYRLTIIIIVLLLASSSYLASQSAAKSTQQQKYATKMISKSSAISIARSQVRGKVLSARLINSRGPAVYRVKMLISDRRVRTVFVDGKSGKVIKVN